MVERGPEKAGVGGSIPSLGMNRLIASIFCSFVPSQSLSALVFRRKTDRRREEISLSDHTSTTQIAKRVDLFIYAKLSAKRIASHTSFKTDCGKFPSFRSKRTVGIEAIP